MINSYLGIKLHMNIYFASSNSLQALQYLAKKMRTKEQSEGSELGRAIQVALT